MRPRGLAAALRRAGLTACVTMLAGLCGVAEAQDQRLNRELATDRFGADLRALALPSDAQCHEACASDPQCRAYTYALPNAPRGAGMCWLKNGPTAPSDAPGYVSGAKGAVGDMTVVVANLRGASPRFSLPPRSPRPLIFRPGRSGGAAPSCSAPPGIARRKTPTRPSAD